MIVVFFAENVRDLMTNQRPTESRVGANSVHVDTGLISAPTTATMDTRRHWNVRVIARTSVAVEEANIHVRR